MNYEKRVDLASRFTELLLKKFEVEIILGGIYGSTAKGTDTEYSDLEMFSIVKNESKAKSFSFACESIPVNVCVRKLVDVERNINEIELDWSLKTGRLRLDVEKSKLRQGHLDRLVKCHLFLSHSPLLLDNLGILAGEEHP